MHGVGGVGPATGGVEHSFVDHRPGAVVALLARLEHQHHVSGEPVAVLREQPGRAGEHCSVQIVPAGVHRAVRRGVVEPGALVDGQGVHVGAQQDRALRLR